jgi:signal peptidase I
LPFERARSTGTTGSAAGATSLVKGPDAIGAQRKPDLSRFLEASEASDDDDGKNDGDEGGANRGGSGRRRRFFVGLFALIVIVAAAALVLRVFVVQPYYIPSASMEPTLHGCPGCNDDHILVDKISYRIHGVRAGDIVVFHRPKNAPTSIESVLVKRVIALGGDTVALKQGHVYVNGLVQEESYLNQDHSCYTSAPDENFAARTVPKGDVFVMGDNRCDSTDSRDFGPVPTSSIIGRAFAIIWPFHRIGLL